MHRNIWLIGLLVTGILSTGCMQFRTSSKKVIKRFEERDLSVSVENEKIEGHEIRYVMVNKEASELPMLVFVHGAPGSSDNFYQFMEDPDLYSRFRMISLDRPGYGYSGFGKSVTSIESQARIINDIVHRYSKDSVILVGHSFGGPIAAKAAYLSPETYSSVIMLAPAVDPENEKIFKIAYLGYRAPFRWITPRSWKVAADEKLTHIAELKKMESDWADMTTPLIHMHGDKDRLVPFANLEFSKRMINPEILEVIHLEGEDHFLPWTQKTLIKETIFREVNRSGSSARSEP